MRIRLLPRLIVGASLAAIALLTLLPASGTNTTSGFACVFCGQLATADAILNMLLFVPLGVGLALIGFQLRTAFLVAAFLSGGIELLQLYIPGRDASTGDLLSNILGCVLGFAVVAWSGWWMYPSPRTASALSAGWAVVIVGMISLTAFLLQPSYPHTAYYGHWTPNFGHLEWYRGKVLDARIGAQFIRSWRLEHSDSVRAALLQGAPVEVRALAGPAVSDLAPLFAIGDERLQTILLIGLDREDLVYRYRMRAADYRLAQPDVRIEGVMALEQGDSIRIRVWRDAERYCIAANARTTCEAWFNAGTGWRFLLSEGHFPSWMNTGLDILWIATLLAPLGFWFRTTWSSGAAGLLIVLALALIPNTSGLLTTRLVDWVGGGMGLVIGLIVGARVRASGFFREVDSP